MLVCFNYDWCKVRIVFFVSWGVFDVVLFEFFIGVKVLFFLVFIVIEFFVKGNRLKMNCLNLNVLGVFGLIKVFFVLRWGIFLWVIWNGKECFMDVRKLCLNMCMVMFFVYNFGWFDEFSFLVILFGKLLYLMIWILLLSWMMFFMCLVGNVFFIICVVILDWFNVWKFNNWGLYIMVSGLLIWV